jgi:chromosome segregation ATPase
MRRIHAPVDEPTLAQIEEEVKKKGLSSRAQWLCVAIDYYLHLRGADPNQMLQEMAQLRSTNDSLQKEIQQLKDVSSDAAQLRGKLAQMEEHEAQVEEQLQQARLDAAKTTDLKDELERQKAQYNQSLTEATQRWEELKSLKTEISKRKKDLDAAQTTTQRLQTELLNKQTEVDRIAALKEELTVAKTDRERLQEALKVRDEGIAFLRGHLSQLSEKLPKSLPPSEEEAKKKGWSWKFWK